MATKMLFYLTTLRVSNVLTENEPEPPVAQEDAPLNENQVDAHQREIEAWGTNEYNCQNYILNALDDSLYDIYLTFGTTKEILESLDSKYKTEVTCSKRFVVGKFLNYRMIEGKPVMKQIEELQILSHELEVEGMGINTNFLVGAIIDKLPHTWKNFKLYLKHLSEDITFEQLVLKLRVEEDNRQNERTDAPSLEPNANMVEEALQGKRKQSMTKRPFHSGKRSDVKSQEKFKKVMHCWVCGKPGHRAKDCRHKRDQGGAGGNGGGGMSGANNQANLTLSPNQFISVVETHMVTNLEDWWVDTGATRHICNSRSLFDTYQEVKEKNQCSWEMLLPQQSKEGEDHVDFGKDLILTDVLHVPSLTKNLIYGPILSKKGFKIVFESDKFVITKGGAYVGKGYLHEGLLKLYVNNSVNIVDAAIVNNENKAGTSTASMYIMDPTFLWHSRLGHVNFRSLQRMIKLDMIPKCTNEKMSKMIYVITRQLLQEDESNYYISFIDDCNKFCHVYLIHTKDEALNMFKIYKAGVENQLEKKIKILRSDCGGEYESNDFAELCALHGIIHQTTAPYTPQQNGVAERKNRTLKNMMNSMLITAGSPHHL
ncbi:LOW QUALITY PROTEIN: hypothetical protein OSB04_011502 [Centaurea solstitialis]|uniref:Polyprotein n=1 Tax=Centaurea solstitialis TaxID=347529 RepID=A0AA38T9J1_9ASTR|nr:LOW QUALITY PROTEIN: hypothetical protein OSB04_011502 [Centaurea solstitialis]